MHSVKSVQHEAFISDLFVHLLDRTNRREKKNYTTNKCMILETVKGEKETSKSKEAEQKMVKFSLGGTELKKGHILNQTMLLYKKQMMGFNSGKRR